MTINISGKVIKGQGYGKVLGFPTANIDRRDFVRQKLTIKLGVYAGSVSYQLSIINYQLYKAAIVIGPIDKTGLPKIEAHLLDFKGNLYGKKLVVSLKKYLRPFKKFRTEEELKRQIKKDINRIKPRTHEKHESHKI